MDTPDIVKLGVEVATAVGTATATVWRMFSRRLKAIEERLNKKADQEKVQHMETQHNDHALKIAGFTHQMNSMEREIRETKETLRDVNKKQDRQTELLTEVLVSVKARS